LIVAALFGREQLTSRKIVSVALAFTGIVVVFGPEAYGGKVSSYLMGDGLMLLGAFSAAIYSVFARSVIGKYGPMFVMVLAVVFGVLALLPLAFASGRLAHWPRFSSEGWLAVIFLGTVGAAMQFSLFTWALRWLPPNAQPDNGDIVGGCDAGRSDNASIDCWTCFGHCRNLRCQLARRR
jgi:drug/metabolite transporter (DMT)-like permease